MHRGVCLIYCSLVVRLHISSCFHMTLILSHVLATCLRLPDVPHAHLSDKYQQGHVICFLCQICYIVPCELPEDTPNGYYQIIHGEDFVFGTTIKYLGYQMVSRIDTRTCLQDKWTNHVPVCDPPPAEKWVIVRGLPDNDNPILPDSFLRFSCQGPGKFLNGSSVLICGKDGQWDNPFPTCEAEPMHSYLNVPGTPLANQKMKIGNKLWFYCTDEYALEGPEEITCLEIGQWNAPFPTCTGIFTFSYQSGHNVQGMAEIQCLANGQWSHPFPTCGGYGRPPTLANGDIKESVQFEYRHHEKLEYACQALYLLAVNPYKTCFNGEWIGQMTCLKQRFYIGKKPIPTMNEEAVKTLGCLCDATLKDTEQEDQLRQDTISGLEGINKFLLLSRLKLWCLQFSLLT
uniref:Sushi domain-containing protein n=1 Tax=Mola mola TaxID=94237 RepID=A0A3Q4ACK5_MOLML